MTRMERFSVDNITLTPAPFLDGYTRDFDGTTLAEVIDVSLISIAQPLEGRKDLQNAVRAVWECELPAPGHSSMSMNNNTRLLCLGPDTFFAILSADAPVAAVSEGLGSAAYTTDQSDNWVTLRLAGSLARPALERICPVDLHTGAMPAGAFARTVMEHLGAIVLREDDDKFILMSASSSARSFLQSVETSLEHVR